MKLLADENVSRYLIDELKHLGYAVRDLKQISPRASDSQVAQIAVSAAEILITHDSDLVSLLSGKKYPSLKLIHLDTPNLTVNQCLQIARLLHENGFLQKEFTFLQVHLHGQLLSISLHPPTQ